MKTIGGYLFFFGLGSIILNMLGYEFRLLMWIDNWGTGVGWGIRLVLVVGGGVLWLLGNKAEEAGGG